MAAYLRAGMRETMIVTVSGRDPAPRNGHASGSRASGWHVSPAPGRPQRPRDTARARQPHGPAPAPATPGFLPGTGLDLTPFCNSHPLRSLGAWVKNRKCALCSPRLTMAEHHRCTSYEWTAYDWPAGPAVAGRTRAARPKAVRTALCPGASASPAGTTGWTDCWRTRNWRGKSPPRLGILAHP